MKDRIVQIMEKEGYNSSRFAEEIGIQRAAMSHIVNGRNNPSLDVITRILQRFPKVNSNWLLFGKGNMYDEKNTGMSDLFTNEADISGESTDVSKYAKEIAPKTPENVQQIPYNELFKPVETPNRNVTKIMIFYSDNTFDTFIPEKNPK